MPERGIPQFSTVLHHKKGRDFDDVESEGSWPAAEPAAERAPAAAAVSDGGNEPEPDAGSGGGADDFHALRSIPEPSETPGGGTTHYVGLLVHSKSSDRENDADALSKADEKSQLKVEEVEVHKDGSGNNLPLFSLRDIHKSSDGHAGALDLGDSHHAKSSEEKDAQNPEVEPERWIPPPPEEPAPPAPSADAGGDEVARPGAAAGGEAGPASPEVERVSVAPEPPADTYEMCAPVDGRYRHPSSGEGKAGSGVVIRYQYELIQSTRPGDGGSVELVDDILPRLEEGITDKLLPVFFEECSGSAGEVYDNRGLAGEGGLRRRLGVGEVVGIDAHPADVAIGGDCQVYTVRDPFQTTTCHRIEGSMTLFFPPNAAVSTLLRSARLSALRAVAAGMEDGSLNVSHDGIRSLIFLDSSHKFDAILPPDEVVAEPEVVKGGGNGNGSGGFIALGVTVSVLLLAACAVGFVLYRRAPFQLRVKRKAASPRRRSRRESTEEEEGKLIRAVMPSKKERRKRKGKKSRSRGRPSGGDSADTDVKSADGTTDQSEHDGEPSDREEDAATASEDEGQASQSDDSSSSSSDEEVGGGAPIGSDSSSDEDDDFDASASNVLYSTFELSLKEEARKAREKKLERRRARIHRRLRRHNRNINRNVVMTGGGEEESVATGVSAGVHSVSSSATDMVRNSAGGTTRDDASVMTGVSAATEMVRNTSGPRARAKLVDDASAVTGVSTATEKAGNVVPKY